MQNTPTETDSVWFISKDQWQRRLVRIFVSVMLLILMGVISTGTPRGAGTAGANLALAARAAAHVNDPRDAFASLPLAAQATISTTLGRDDCAYHALPSPAGFQAQNRPHGLEVAFTRGGVNVHADEARIGLSLEAWGYGEALGSLAPVAPEAEANRVSYKHGPLEEWYVNGPLGLEQGFTLAAPPASPDGGPLTLALALTGNLRASLAARGDELTLASETGVPALRYCGLTVNDAGGRELAAWLELRDQSLLLRVDDAGARYPLSIDPLVQQAKLTASDGAAADRFGTAIAMAGNTIVVGAPFGAGANNPDQGSAYVFVRPAMGWAGALTEQAKLTASDGAAFDQFGVSVAIAGNTIVVGTLFGDGPNFPNQGAAYVFVKPAGGWAGALTEQAKLTASDGVVFDEFGFSVAIAANTIVVGAIVSDGPAFLNQGSAYVFVRPDSGWAGALTEQAKLTASDAGSTDNFGFSVAIAGNTIVVGAVQNHGGQGAAYVFVKPAGGWAGALTEQAKLTASDGAGNFDEFGFSVAIAGNTIVVGALFGDGANVDQGAAYIFDRPAGGWVGVLTEQAKLTASDGAAFDQFGSSVAIAGNTIVVGALADDVGANTDQGSAYVFGN